MKLFANIKNFAADESGAVTVDWVVLTAAIVGLGIAVIASVRTGTSELAGTISTAIGGATVGAGGIEITDTTGGGDE
ncbi:Flp family type IVb pilin [Roseinatronobacter sp.]|uniref:Flp family type IVb pilin n=1 Tax=Roseinatronobacter sp. TaxID=1945755 RepID=UPI003F70609A